MSTDIRELMEPSRAEQDAAQERIIASLTSGQYDGMVGGVRDTYRVALSRYESVREHLRDDTPSWTRNTVKGAYVEQKLRAAGMSTAPYDYVQVRVDDDRRELHFLGDEERVIDASGHSITRELYDSVRSRDDRSPGQVLHEGVIRNAVRQEIQDAVETHARTDVPHGVTKTIVLPRG